MKEDKRESKKEEKRFAIEALKCVRLFVVIAVAASAGIFAYIPFFGPKEPELTTSFVNGKLEAVSDLTVSELNYTGLIRYSEGKIPFLTQNSFSMMYTANVRAGIDISKAQIAVSGDEVVITLPECEVQSIDIDPDSIEFYDEHLALFNWTEKEDIIDTVSAGQQDVSEKADLDSLLEAAEDQTKALIGGLLSDAIGERELKIQ